MESDSPLPLTLRFQDPSGMRTFSLDGSEITIGRSSRCDLYIQDDTISRQHARIHHEKGFFLLEDLKSRNGIEVGGHRVESAQLQPGMVFQMGAISILVEANSASSINLFIDRDLPQQGVAGSLVLEDFKEHLESNPLSDDPKSRMGAALHLFKDAAETLLTGDRLEQVAQGAADLVLKALPVDRCVLSLLEDGKLVPCASESRDGVGEQGEMQISRTIARQVMDEHRSVLIRDTLNMGDLASADSIIDMKITSALCSPLVSGDEVVGILYVDCIDHKAPLNTDHLDTISVLALMVSSTLEQVRLRQFAEEEKRRRVDLSCRLSPNVVERVLSGEAELGSKEVEITVLFADLVGFTSMSERMRPTEVVELLNELFEELTSEVFDQDGTLDKYIGDAVVAFFGAPEEQSNHPVRAVTAALAMQERVAELIEKHPEWPPLSLRIGVNSGNAVVGDIGSRLRSDYTVIGDTVNTASRLESQVAGAGEVVVGPLTAERCRQMFEMEPLPEAALKGKKIGVKPWKILGARTCSDGVTTVTY